MRDSDSLYHRLFSHPRMVEELVREFIPQSLVAGLDFRGLQRINPKFHPTRRPTRRRDGDVIWKLPTHAGSEIYFYLLMEFQSDSDAWMAVRTQVYQGLLWQQVIDENELRPGARLPPLLLLVLYNGKSRWNAATTTHELIELRPDSALMHWQPQARYFLLDMGAFPREALTLHPGLAALLFRLEGRNSPEDLAELGNEVIRWFRQHEGYERLRKLFIELIGDAVAGQGAAVTKSSI